MGLFKHLEKKISKFGHQSETPTKESDISTVPNTQNNGIDNHNAFNNRMQFQVQQPSPPPIPTRDYGKFINPVQGKRHDISTSSFSYSDSSDIFNTPITTEPPVSNVCSSSIHPVPLPKFYDSPGPIETNNFYGNLLVEDQNLPVWTHPYSIWKSTDDQFKGLGISHTSSSQRVYGDDPNSNPVKYFFNPVGICSLMLSAEEFESQGFNFLVGDLQRFSAGLKFAVANGELRSTIVQGMGFITGIYEGNITPRIASKLGVKTLQPSGTISNGLSKYIVTLFDETRWVVYSNATFNLQSPNSIGANPAGSQVLVQIAKLNGESTSKYYDEAAGSYVTFCSLSSTIESNTCSYSFNYTIKGSSNSNKVIQWFLPHHIESMHKSMLPSLADGLNLDSTCKGVMSGFLTDKFLMTEELQPDNLKFDPWSDTGGVLGYSENAKYFIAQVAQQEVSTFDVVNESNTDSMYTAGKILDKGAYMLYVVAFVLEDNTLATTMLAKMKEAFARFLENKQQAPLCYDSNWKGIVSTSGLRDGNFYCDFGNCFYNDHHFHYGYHVHAASLVALVDNKYGDGTWLATAKPWIESLIRDFCNPSAKDTYFPVFRSFDFYNGHSFANGLFAHGDGKDEESSSEDYHAYYGVKLWGLVSNNSHLFTLASLILSVEKRAMGLYMLYKNSNKNMPANFIRNKVSGILFENKIDHATYFGMNKEYIHGIHMIPITPMSNYVRDTEFVTEEWNEMALGQLANSIDGGWKGLLMLNLALCNPKEAWQFFSQENFQMSWLDNGMSRTWSLAYCAGMGGCS